MTDVLQNDHVRAVIDPARGARLTSLAIDGDDVLGRAGDPTVDPAIADGCFPMVPWAGRIRGGKLIADGTVHQLPLADDGNALHGLGHDAAWQRTGEGAYALPIGEPWPTHGVATLNYTLLPRGIRIELDWDDDTVTPCSLGLHPWFRRRLGHGDELVATFHPDRMVERGDDGLPTGRLVDPSPGPWDDCFSLGSPPVLVWPGALTLTLTSSATWWVVYDQPAGTVCVEPQTAPPDSFSHPGLQPDGAWPRSLWLEITAQHVADS